LTSDGHYLYHGFDIRSDAIKRGAEAEVPAPAFFMWFDVGRRAGRREIPPAPPVEIRAGIYSGSIIF
jgi:hypothetical protein